MKSGEVWPTAASLALSFVTLHMYFDHDQGLGYLLAGVLTFVAAFVMVLDVSGEGR